MYLLTKKGRFSSRKSSFFPFIQQLKITQSIYKSNIRFLEMKRIVFIVSEFVIQKTEGSIVLLLSVFYCLNLEKTSPILPSITKSAWLS